MIEGDPYAKCWLERMISPTVLEDYRTKPVIDLSGNPIKTTGGRKQLVYLEKIIPELKSIQGDDIKAALAERIKPISSGDNSYTGVRKYIIPFLRHMKTIDSEDCLTENGLLLYHLGLVNGPTSKVYYDYFAKELLTTGHHLDVILDFDAFKHMAPGRDFKQVRKEMEKEYESKGYVKRNPGRKKNHESKVGFLKYERIIWKALGLIDNKDNVQWKRVTEICSLPDK
jgi:hypothetical protein